VSPSQLIAAALRELLAHPRDLDMAKGYVADISTSDLDAVAEQLVELAGLVCSRQASLRVKAGAR
jgi:hypothetical protein